MDQLYSINIRHTYETIKNEGWPFIFICTYLFFEYVRPQSIYTWLDILPWTQLILILTIISFFFEKDRYSTGTILNKLIIVYAVVVLLSSLNSTYPGASFSRLRTFFDWFLIYFLIVKIVNNEKRFFIFLLSFLIFSFKMSQHGARSWIMRGFSFAGWGVTGAPGWFQNSGEVGIQMCIFVPLSVAFIFAAYKYLSKPWCIFFYLMPIAGILTIIASSSRGAMVGLVGSAFWAIKRRPKYLIPGAVILAVVFFVIYQLIPQESINRFEQSGQDKTSLHRMERWHQGIEAMKSHPVFGVGFDIWDLYYPDHYVPEYKGSYLVHNFFIQCGSELGYSGLSILVCMILSCFYMTRKVRMLSVGSEDKFLSRLSYGMDSALIGLLVSASFVTVLYYPYLWIHCALTSSLYIAANRKFGG